MTSDGAKTLVLAMPVFLFACAIVLLLLGVSGPEEP